MSSKRYSLPIPFGWYCVAFTEDLKVGDVKPVHYFGKELVVFRTESGEAKVLDAYCPHLGAHLGHGGKVKGESIACPFHGWQFNGGGQCTAVPYAKNMPPKVAGGKQAVYAYPTVEKNQVIWAWYHPQRVEPTFDVVDLPQYSSKDWTAIERFKWVINTTIQETGENAADAAHFLFTHNATEMPKGDVTFNGHQRQAIYNSTVRVMNADGTYDEDASKKRSSYVDTNNSGPGQTWQHFQGMMETMLMGLVTPIDDQSLELHFVFTQPAQQGEQEKMIAKMTVTELVNQVGNDIPIWEHKMYLENPMLCDGDGPIHQYRKWFRQFYAEPVPEPINVRAVG
jgi:phenylpropionate dioxygenase-like ring-hydroxylating dioxygenase large terminal subunit